ncbi:MAG TPA: glycosyltransferase [Candidatus Saccharimonadia bacterium]|nr:glycosyltransferase [Candidatus Saccharimonadia bacterium]
MNILFANYGQSDNNSAYHIAGFASGLAARGHDVCVAVAKSVPDGKVEQVDGFRLVSHRTALKTGVTFADGRPADVLHVWTPRETMRQFANAHATAWGHSALIVHLEDNEEAIFERFTGCSLEKACTLDEPWPKGLIHPRLYRGFLDSAKGVTMVHRCLESLAPAGLPKQEIVPVMDFRFFSNGPRNESFRRELGLASTTRVVVFNGNDHAAAALDIRQLYEAVDLLIEGGMDLAFVRTGHVLPANYDGLHFRPGARCHELGFVERDRVPEIMRLADVAVQPGDGDYFNAHRLPAKVPEYLAMGKPLVMGETNIGRELAGAKAALILPGMSPQQMAEAVARLLNSPEEAAAMGARGREFARNRFSREAVIPLLESFYRSCLPAPATRPKVNSCEIPHR